MKYLLLFLTFIAMPALSQDKVNKLVVVCDAGKNPKTFTSIVDADAYAKTRPCPNRTWLQADYNYVKAPSSSSSFSSAKSLSSSSVIESSTSSQSSNSSAPKAPTLTLTCPKTRANGEALAQDQIGGYDLMCDGRHEIFTSSSCDVSYTTSLPALTKTCQIAVFDKSNVYSSYVVVAQ